MLVPQRGGNQDGERDALAREHRDAAAVHAQIQNAHEQEFKWNAHGRAGDKGEHVGRRLALRAQQAGEHEAGAQQRAAGKHIARIGCGGGDDVLRAAQQADERRGKQRARYAQQDGERQGGEEGRRRDGVSGGFVPAAQAAADEAARAHAQREAERLDEREQRKADGDGGGERGAPPGEEQRVRERAHRGGQHGGHAGHGDAQNQRRDGAGEQIAGDLRFHGSSPFWKNKV